MRDICRLRGFYSTTIGRTLYPFNFGKAVDWGRRLKRSNPASIATTDGTAIATTTVGKEPPSDSGGPAI